MILPASIPKRAGFIAMEGEDASVRAECLQAGDAQTECLWAED